MSIITLKTENSEITDLLKALLKQLKGVEMVDETSEAKIIGYTINKKPVFLDDYQKEISKRIKKIKSGKAKTYSSQEVRNSILK